MATVVSCWGWGGNGQLGLGDRDSRIKPQVSRALAHESVRRVVCGSRCTLALTAQGTVFAWGKNDYGQLGTGDTKAQIEPRLVEALAGVTVVAIASRGSHVLALSDTGRVFSWGRGDEGQLGHGDRKSRSLPHYIAALSDHRVRLIAAGRSHSVAVSDSGEIFTWGSNDDGALGRESDGDETTGVLPGLVDASVFLGASITQIECGSRHNVALTSDQRVFTWGWGIYGQLGTGDTVSRSRPTELPVFRGKKVQKIFCGFRHSFVVLPRRITRRLTASSMTDMFAPDAGLSRVDVWGWGWNEHGQLGQAGLANTVLKPTKIEALSSVYLHLLAAGGRHTVCHFGVEADDELSHSPATALRRARSETDPRTHQRQKFQTIAWGRGSDGELGVGTVMTSSPPVSLPAFQGSQLVDLSCGWAHTASLGTNPILAQQDDESSSVWSRVTVSVGDVDAFVGLLVQFIIQILLIFQLLPVQCGFSAAQVTAGIIPAAAATVAMGNVFFGLYATALQKRESRFDVTALPDGINTVLVFAYVLSVMAPEYARTQSAERAWEAGVFAAFMTGLMQIMCLPFVSFMRRCIPRAALLSSVAGVALAFLTMGFAFQVWQNPLIALSPLFLVFICLGAGVKLPLHVPTGLGALLLGTCSAFILYYFGYPMEFSPFSQPFEFEFGLLRPDFSLFFRAMTSGEGWKYLSVVVPMVLVNVMSTLANLETAAAVGDNYDATMSIFGDSISTMIGACLGNPFPTSVYIGQPIYKSMGARVSYVFLTAVAVVLIALLDAATMIVNTVPISCGVGFLLWIGLVISASSFSHTPSSNTNHGTAVALGMVPALASWAFQLVQSAIVSTHSVALTAYSGADTALSLQRVLDALTAAGVNPSGMIALSQGYLLTSIFLASTMVNIIEREFLRASAWMGVAAVLSATGVVHSFVVDGDVVRGAFGVFPGGAYGFAARYSAAYGSVAAMLLLFHLQEGNDISAAPLWKTLQSVTSYAKQKHRQWKKTRLERSHGERDSLLP